jgi:hypothetical protein
VRRPHPYRCNYNDSLSLPVCLASSLLTINSQAGIKLGKKQAILVGIHKRLQHLNIYEL